MIGTVPDSDFGLTETAFRSYLVLEPAATHLGDVVPGPAAALLVRAGPGRAAALWDQAARLARVATEAMEAMEDWHPALVMAALSDGPEVTIADLDVLASWLPRHANQVAPGQQAAVLRGFLDDAACRPQHLAALGVLARLVADPELTVRIERKAVTEEVQRWVGSARRVRHGCPDRDRGRQDLRRGRVREAPDRGVGPDVGSLARLEHQPQSRVAGGGAGGAASRCSGRSWSRHRTRTPSES